MPLSFQVYSVLVELAKNSQQKNASICIFCYQKSIQTRYHTKPVPDPFYNGFPFWARSLFPRSLFISLSPPSLFYLNDGCGSVSTACPLAVTWAAFVTMTWAKVFRPKPIIQLHWLWLLPSFSSIHPEVLPPPTPQLSWTSTTPLWRTLRVQSSGLLLVLQGETLRGFEKLWQDWIESQMKHPLSLGTRVNVCWLVCCCGHNFWSAK